MPESALIKARVPTMDDGPYGGEQIQAAVLDLEPYVVPRFATDAARDAAYALWVQAGNTLVRGQECWTGDGGPQEYTATGWKPAGVGVDAPIFRLERKTTVSIATGFVDNFAWDSRTDPLNMCEGSGPTWTFVTIPRDGWYATNLGIDFSTVGSYRVGLILQTVGKSISNAADPGLLARLGYRAGTGGDGGTSASDLLPLTKGTRLRCGTYHDLSTAANVSGSVPYATTYWSMAWQRAL